MDWKWTLVSIVAVGAGWFFFHFKKSNVDEEHCPYKVGTDRTDCGGKPCEMEPPCLHP